MSIVVCDVARDVDPLIKVDGPIPALGTRSRSGPRSTFTLEGAGIPMMRTLGVRSAVGLGIVVTALIVERTAVGAQVVNPADKSRPDPQQQAAEPPPRHTWEMPPITVYGEAPLKEEDRIGDYAQPRWTAHRRFGETRVYVIPKGMVEFEYWLRPRFRKHGEPSTWEHQYEVEFGLPGRFQLDLYAVAHKTGKEGALGIDQQKVEVRWALADWGKIWGNPTLYAEWVTESESPDVAELKLLLGGEITSGWHWGSNLVWEHETGGTRETSNEWTLGVSRTVRDMKVAAGVESQFALVNERGEDGRRTDFEKELLIGPSVQFRPLPQMHIDIAPLFGVTAAAPRAKIYIVMGWEF